MAQPGANIANATGRPNSGGTAWSNRTYQDPIGGYVQDVAEPDTVTNYIGANPQVAYATNPVSESDTDPFSTSAPQPNFLVPSNDNVAIGGTMQLVKNGAAALIPTDKVTIAAGVATKDNASGTHNVFATVPANYFFWAVTAA